MSAPLCGHAAPTFGCIPCIKSDLSLWARKTFDAWKAATKITPCVCGYRRDAQTYYLRGEKLIVEVYCMRLNGFDGTGCWRGDAEVEIQ